jgi:hypothetical protein
MADRGVRAARRAARRNGPVENAAVDIAEVVDNQIDVDSDSSSDNELLEEVVRVPHGRARPPAVIAPLAMDPGLWLNMVNVKPPYLLDLEIESMKKFIRIRDIPKNAPDNFYAPCSSLCSRNTWKSSVAKQKWRWKKLWSWRVTILLRL